MNDKQVTFFVMVGVSALMMGSNFLVAKLIKRTYARFNDLLTSGLETKGKVLSCKKLSTKGRKLFMVEYEFQTATGTLLKGKADIAQQTADIVVGAELPVLYMDNKPTVNSLKNGLQERVDRTRKACKIIGFLPLQGAVILAVLWFILVTNHIVQLPS